MERDIDDLVKESKEFIELRKKDKQSRNPEAGTPAYLVSQLWLKKYKKFILY